MPLIEQSAKVVAIDNDKVRLITNRESSCSGCRLKQGCGTGLLENHVGNKFSDITVQTQQQVELEQQVTVAISETCLLQGALFVYLVPLLMLLLFAMISRYMTMSDELEIIFGLLGLIIGFIVVKIGLRNREDSFAVLMKEETK